MSGGSDSSLRWVVTYADMISLLMVLFLLLFSASQVQKEKLMALSESMRRALHKDASTGSSTGVALMASPERAVTTAASEAIQEAARAMGIDKSISFSTDERGTIIAMVDTAFFAPGSAEINAKTKPLLREVGIFCKETSAEIRVEGHTDNVAPKGNADARTNWQLAALRATNVVEFFIQSSGLEPHRVSAASYGDTRPLFPNTSPNNRARNRRIEIVLLTSEVLQQGNRSKSLTNINLIERDFKQKEEQVEKLLSPTATEAKH